MGKKFLAILNSHGCKNVMSNPTRVTQSTKSTIDLAIANNPPEVSNSGVLDLSIADHEMIFVTYKMKIKNPGFLIKRVRNYRGLDEKSLQKDLQDVPWWVTSLFDDIDDVTYAWELLFKDVFSVKATKYDSRRSKQLVLDRPKKEIGRLSLRHRGTMIWNSIPSSVKDYDNATSFKNRLKQYFKFMNNFTFEKESSLLTNISHHFYYY